MPLLYGADEAEIKQLTAGLTQLMFSGQLSVSNGQAIIHQLTSNLKKCQQDQLTSAVGSINNLIKNNNSIHECKYKF